jgi:hypothetical protein
VKSREKLPVWLLTAMEQAKAAVRGNQKPWVVLHEVGRRYAEGLVMFRLRDVAALFDELGKVENDGGWWQETESFVADRATR